MQIRQTKLRRNGQRRLVVDKVFITYKDKTVTFELQKGTTKRGKKSKTPQSKILIGTTKPTIWKRKTIIDKTLGALVLKSLNGKTIQLTVSSLGFTMKVKRGNIFFRVIVLLNNEKSTHSGLCNWVPSNLNEMMFSQYQTYASSSPIATKDLGTKVS